MNLNRRDMPATRRRAAPDGANRPDDLRLSDIPLGETVELVHFDLPGHELEPLLERGVLPGCMMCPIARSPFGDPIVEVEGTRLALRREMAGCLCVRRGATAAA